MVNADIVSSCDTMFVFLIPNAYLFCWSDWMIRFSFSSLGCLSGRPAMFFTSSNKSLFRFALAHRLFNILCDFMSSLGWLHSSLMLFKVRFNSSRSAKQSKMNNFNT